MKPSSTIKVLFFLPNLMPGGAERILITLMNNIDRDVYAPEFVVLSGDGPAKEWIAEDVPFYALGARSIRGSIFKLVKFIKHHKPDILFTTMVHSNALALLTKIIFPHIKVVVREAALPSVIVSEYGLKGRLCKWVYKFLYPRADLVIDNCSQVVDQFRDEIKIDISNHKILFNPVDVERLYAQIPERFEGAGGDITRFVCVGRLSFEKGYDRLIEALASFLPDKKWRLDIIGEGGYRGALEALITKHNLSGHVFLRGYLSNPWAVAAQADCLLLPSRWEGMPNVVLEGFACGVPAIALREAGGIIDIAKHTRPGELKIVETVDDMVAEMARVKSAEKNKPAPSILPPAFKLEHVVEQLEKMLA